MQVYRMCNNVVKRGGEECGCGLFALLIIKQNQPAPAFLTPVLSTRQWTWGTFGGGVRVRIAFGAPLCVVLIFRVPVVSNRTHVCCKSWIFRVPVVSNCTFTELHNASVCFRYIDAQQ